MIQLNKLYPGVTSAKYNVSLTTTFLTRRQIPMFSLKEILRINTCSFTLKTAIQHKSLLTLTSLVWDPNQYAKLTMVQGTVCVAHFELNY